MADPQHPLCIYHSPCADGFTSAWVVKRYFDQQNVLIDFHPGVYGQDPPDVAGRDVFLVDFSYKRPVLDKMIASARSVLVLDHHKTAQADLEHLHQLPPDDSITSGGAVVGGMALFDMDRSGAQITWDFFFPDSARPVLVDYVGDRDLWKFNLPSSRAVNAYIFAHEYNFRAWTQLHYELRRDIGVVANMGAAIEKKHHKDVAELVKVTQRMMRIGGWDMPVANVPWTMTSDAGHLMATEGLGVAACYWDTPAGRTFSLRSTDDGPDVAAIAAQYGGGGHLRAAGFQRPRGWEGDT